MPVYTRTYRHYDGEFRRHARWALIVEQELRILAKTKIFMFLCLCAFLHFLIRLLQVVSYDIIMQDPNHPAAAMLQQAQFIVVKEESFFDFLRFQAPLVLLTCLYAGSGMICNDFRNNLMEVYFSKPITWRDYALGKVLSLILIGLAFTALPGVSLVVLHNMLAPSWETFTETFWWPLEVTGFSLVLVVPCALGVLACSALLQSQNYAAIAVFMVIVANGVLGGLLAAFLRDENYLVLSFPLALNRVGQAIFNQQHLIFALHWGWSMLYIILVSLACAGIIFRRVRRAECAL
ncbi:MAG: ABC transporter permease subunit [Candidatus Hydrogenedentes bacterium]|nr:ABC transporter permease subunit [Candidatus Hydrogenedentota bacterium]